MGVKERRARQKEELRQEILEAARELFAKEGYENVSMRKIAAKIDYTPTTIYLYFTDKHELLDSICEETFARLVKEFEDIVAKHQDPVEQLIEAGRAYVEFGLSHPKHYMVTFMSGESHLTAVEAERAHRGSMGEKCFAHLRAMVEKCVQQGRIRPVDVDAISQGLWAMVHGVTSLLITKPHFPWVEKEKLVAQLLDITTQGLKA